METTASPRRIGFVRRWLSGLMFFWGAFVVVWLWAYGIARWRMEYGIIHQVPFFIPWVVTDRASHGGILILLFAFSSWVAALVYVLLKSSEKSGTDWEGLGFALFAVDGSLAGILLAISASILFQP